MDINKLENFLNYKIDLDIKPQTLVEEIIKKAKKYLPDDCEYEIQKAFNFAKKAHKKEKRLSWEPYIIHPIKSTLILMDLKPDIQSIQTCLLHDVIEDTKITKQEIEKKFWLEISNLCEWLVKVSKIKYKWEDRQLETIKKTFLAMAKDLRVIFIKLADRIHNMQTLNFHPELQKRKTIAEETMKIYVPIAKRLWLYQYQVTLENACFKTLKPKEYNQITKYLKNNFSISDKYIKRWIKLMSKLLQKEWIEDFKVKWRMKSPYRIREKMEYKYQTKDIRNIMDLLAFRIITNNVGDCYNTLWIIHKHYTPLIKKIKDYIAVPKFNGYKSIHTTILGMFRFPAEIQIRTQEMDEIAEYWVAAHYAYSDPDSNKKVNQKQAERMQKLQKLVNAYTESESKENFKDKLDIELLNKEIFIYTPKWDIIEMPKGSTVLDFAFQIHTDIWLRFKSATVNWNIVPISHIPNTWDIIEIKTFRYKYTANKHRVSILRTPSAKNRLIKFTKMEQKNESIEKSTENLNNKLKSLSLPTLKSKEDKISNLYSKKKLEDKLLNALDDKWIYNNIIKNTYPDTYKQKIDKIKIKDKKNEKKQTNIIIDEDKILNYELCPECSPKFGQKIIAKTWKDGIKIHNMWCRAIKTIAPKKFLEAHRQWAEINRYTITSIISCDQKMDLINLLEIFTKFNIEVNNFSVKNDEKNNKKIIKIKRDVNNPWQIWMIYEYTKKFWNKMKVIKRFIE